jgi:putative nucleotidyltransferase with HDIG domain
MLSPRSNIRRVPGSAALGMNEAPGAGPFFSQARPNAAADADPDMGQVLIALSRALDITEGQPPGHAMRAALIGKRIATGLGLDDAERADLFYTVLLKDLGCSSNAARICALYLTDDLAFKHDFKLIGDSLPQALRFVLNHTGLQSGLAARFRAILNIVRNGGEIVSELIESRCQRGASIARRIGFSEEVATGIRDLDEHWDGSGRPSGLCGEAISLFGRIALISQVTDVFRTSAGPEAALHEITLRRGTWFDPHITDCLLDIADTSLWDELEDPALESRVRESEAAQNMRLCHNVGLDEIAAGFAEVVDAKSPFTAGHSARVALYAEMIADEFGFTPERRAVLGRAALLHDIGKLGVSNQILDKPDKLNEREWQAIRAHPVDGCAILGSVDSFAYLARIAEAHHERLDGKGYPYGLDDKDLDLETRIVCVADVFDALTADRPYRSAMPLEKAMSIMVADAGSAFDPDCVQALERVAANL